MGGIIVGNIDSLPVVFAVCRKSSLEEYAKDVSWEKLKKHATEIYDTYTNKYTVEKLQNERVGSVQGGDMVYENVLLFMQDVLLSKEYSDTIKAGDSGQTKYAYKMLVLIHNLKVVWPPAVKAIMLNNWILNPGGNPNSDVEVDLVQEHFNYWNKAYYKAYGSNASWDWLAMIAPCVPVLRHLTRMMKGALGIDIGTKHTAPDLRSDIQALMKSLDENNVYRINQNQLTLEDDDTLKRQKMVPVIGKGCEGDAEMEDGKLPENVPETTETMLVPLSTGVSPTSSDQELAEVVVSGVEDDSEDELGDYEDVDELEEIMNRDKPTLEIREAEDVSFNMDNDWERDEDEGGDEGQDL
ncbi:hypothetical protein Moror_7622 [Moniliophthora roreri MCA 2997]|uniref:DUF6589 domain-containing protein n=2 Tax=Moniliophthora roreri TaxID=221103 RepID=V2XN99_MONRO|nr:hypothetical protein Moror_7622 [Moniliophthora roreri MCA 2997]